jgi:hypothetical protein
VPTTFADAILDRLVNNGYRLELKGKSMRGNGAHRVAADLFLLDKVVRQRRFSLA